MPPKKRTFFLLESYVTIQRHMTVFFVRKQNNFHEGICMESTSNHSDFRGITNDDIFFDQISSLPHDSLMPKH